MWLDMKLVYLAATYLLGCFIPLVTSKWSLFWSETGFYQPDVKYTVTFLEKFGKCVGKYYCYLS